MALSIANILNDVYTEVMFAEPQLAKIVTKDGRVFVLWIRYAGTNLEQWAHYKSGRYRKGRFDLQPTVEGEWPVYRQRPGVGQPRFEWVPSSWIPVDEATTERMDAIKPPKNIFESPSLLSLLTNKS